VSYHICAIEPSSCAIQPSRPLHAVECNHNATTGAYLLHHIASPTRVTANDRQNIRAEHWRVTPGTSCTDRLSLSSAQSSSNVIRSRSRFGRRDAASDGSESRPSPGCIAFVSGSSGRRLQDPGIYQSCPPPLTWLPLYIHLIHPPGLHLS
jgi:hypothetical protein